MLLYCLLGKARDMPVFQVAAEVGNVLTHTAGEGEDDSSLHLVVLHPFAQKMLPSEAEVWDTESNVA